jgi:hypothetical protein
MFHNNDYGPMQVNGQGGWQGGHRGANLHLDHLCAHHVGVEDELDQALHAVRECAARARARRLRRPLVQLLIPKQHFRRCFSHHFMSRRTR